MGSLIHFCFGCVPKIKSDQVEVQWGMMYQYVILVRWVYMHCTQSYYLCIHLTN